MPSINVGSGRRAYWRFLYGSHIWIPTTDTDWSKGMVRDAPRTAIPPNGIRDSSDFLLHQPGIAIKRGGTAYAGPVLPSATATCYAVSYAEFPAAAQLVALGVVAGNMHLFTVTAGTTTDVGAITVSTSSGSRSQLLDSPKLRIGGGKNLLVVASSNGTTGPAKYDGTTIGVLGGSPPAVKFIEVYKTRLVGAGKTGNENRVFFSPTPDIEATWDTTNSWIDCDHAVTGLAALHNTLLIFSQGHTERIIGSTPPPGSDMDRAPVGDIGCTDARSIVVQEGNCLFANPRGVYLTNGAGFASLTTEGQIETYWQSLLTGYDPATWTIAAGVLRSFYFVTITDNNGANVATLMCNVPRRAWWRLTNIDAQMFAQGVGKQDELYYAAGGAARVVQMSGIFTPTASNKNDANGTAVAPMLETRAIGRDPGLKSFGDGQLSFDMRDAAADAPTMAVQFAGGMEATTYRTAAESPFAATTDETKRQWTTGIDGSAISLKFTQTGASSKTEIYAIEQTTRSHPAAAEGQ